MNTVKKLAVVLSLSLLPLVASAASPESVYLKSFSKGPGIPVPVKVVSPEVVSVPTGAVAMISFIVDATGVPQSVTVAETTDTTLATAAVAAVKEWRFNPVVRDGLAVETKVLLPVRVTRDPLAGPSYVSR